MLVLPFISYSNKMGKETQQKDNTVGKLIPLLQCLYQLDKACLFSSFLFPPLPFLIAAFLIAGFLNAVF